MKGEQLFRYGSALGTIFKVLKAREMKVKTEKEISLETPHKMLESTSLLWDPFDRGRPSSLQITMKLYTTRLQCIGGCAWSSAHPQRSAEDL